MKRIILLFLLLAPILTNVLAQVTPKRVTITGQIINSTAETPKVLGVNFLNPFDKNRQSASPDNQMKFAVNEDMLFTQNMTIAYNNTFINLYVAPGDSIHLVIDAALLTQPDFKWLTISGDHSKISTELNLIHNYLSKLPYHKYDYKLSVPDMLETIKKDYERYLIAIKDYAGQHKIDPIVVEFSKRDAKYGISNWISDYVDEGDNNTSTKAERIAMFKNVFFELGDDANFVSMMYPYQLAYYASWKTGTDHQKTKEESIEEIITSGANILLKEPASISRDYMMYSYLSSYINKTPSLRAKIPVMKPYFTDANLYRYLELSASKISDVKIPKTVVSKIQYMQNNKVTTHSNVDFLSLLAKKYPGKVIYLDLYATWCVPCLQEMEFSPALHQKFLNKDVVFVNLCLQSEQKNWVKLLNNKKIKGENYFLNDDDSKLLMGNFNVPAFPTYMLIDRKGQVKTTRASRPSELENLRKEIQHLLSK